MKKNNNLEKTTENKINNDQSVEQNAQLKQTEYDNELVPASNQNAGNQNINPNALNNIVLDNSSTNTYMQPSMQNPQQASPMPMNYQQTGVYMPPMTQTFVPPMQSTMNLPYVATNTYGASPYGVAPKKSKRNLWIGLGIGLGVLVAGGLAGLIYYEVSSTNAEKTREKVLFEFEKAKKDFETKKGYIEEDINKLSAIDNTAFSKKLNDISDEYASYDSSYYSVEEIQKFVSDKGKETKEIEDEINKRKATYDKLDKAIISARELLKDLTIKLYYRSMFIELNQFYLEAFSMQNGNQSKYEDFVNVLSNLEDNINFIKEKISVFETDIREEINGNMRVVNQQLSSIYKQIIPSNITLDYANAQFKFAKDLSKYVISTELKPDDLTGTLKIIDRVYKKDAEFQFELGVIETIIKNLKVFDSDSLLDISQTLHFDVAKNPALKEKTNFFVPDGYFESKIAKKRATNRGAKQFSESLDIDMANFLNIYSDNKKVQRMLDNQQIRIHWVNDPDKKIVASYGNGTKGSSKYIINNMAKLRYILYKTGDKQNNIYSDLFETPEIDISKQIEINNETLSDVEIKKNFKRRYKELRDIINENHLDDKFVENQNHFKSNGLSVTQAMIIAKDAIKHIDDANFNIESIRQCNSALESFLGEGENGKNHTLLNLWEEYRKEWDRKISKLKELISLKQNITSDIDFIRDKSYIEEWRKALNAEIVTQAQLLFFGKIDTVNSYAFDLANKSPREYIYSGENGEWKGFLPGYENTIEKVKANYSKRVEDYVSDIKSNNTLILELTSAIPKVLDINNAFSNMLISYENYASNDEVNKEFFGIRDTGKKVSLYETIYYDAKATQNKYEELKKKWFSDSFVRTADTVRTMKLDLENIKYYFTLNSQGRLEILTKKIQDISSYYTKIRDMVKVNFVENDHINGSTVSTLLINQKINSNNFNKDNIFVVPSSQFLSYTLDGKTVSYNEEGQKLVSLISAEWEWFSKYRTSENLKNVINSGSQEYYESRHNSTTFDARFVEFNKKYNEILLGKKTKDDLLKEAIKNQFTKLQGNFASNKTLVEKDSNVINKKIAFEISGSLTNFMKQLDSYNIAEINEKRLLMVDFDQTINKAVIANGDVAIIKKNAIREIEKIKEFKKNKLINTDEALFMGSSGKFKFKTFDTLIESINYRVKELEDELSAIDQKTDAEIKKTELTNLISTITDAYIEFENDYNVFNETLTEYVKVYKEDYAVMNSNNVNGKYGCIFKKRKSELDLYTTSLFNEKDVTKYPALLTRIQNEAKKFKTDMTTYKTNFDAISELIEKGKELLDKYSKIPEEHKNPLREVIKIYDGKIVELEEKLLNNNESDKVKNKLTKEIDQFTLKVSILDPNDDKTWDVIVENIFKLNEVTIETIANIDGSKQVNLAISERIGLSAPRFQLKDSILNEYGVTFVCESAEWGDNREFTKEDDTKLKYATIILKYKLTSIYSNKEYVSSSAPKLTIAVSPVKYNVKGKDGEVLKNFMNIPNAK